MRYLFLVSTWCTLVIMGCKTTTPATDKKIESVEVRITTSEAGMTDTLRLFAWNGVQVEEVTKTAPTKETSANIYTLSFPTPPPAGLYYLGASLKDIKPVILGMEALVELEGADQTPKNWTFLKSPINNEHEALIERLKNQNESFFQLVTDYQANLKDAAKLETIKKQMAALDDKKVHLLDSMRQANPFLGKIVELNTYLSYQNNSKEGQSEGVYLGETFFQFTDLQDSTYARLPYFFEAVKSYANNITKVGLTNAQQTAFLNALIDTVSIDNPNRRTILLGISFGIMPTNKGLFAKYGKMYMEDYKGQSQQIDKFLEAQIKAARGPLPVGDAPPAIQQPDPEGNMIDLNQFKGKVLLIDFWASWCGPCRRENPNVVRLYNKYKDKGFEILGVSLDTKKQRWVDAIKKDQLTWAHVSDLQGWSSKAAKDYGVKGIPFTVLLDADGNILATKLRGQSLENKLAELFGE